MNEITIKKQYSLLLLQETLAKLGSAKYNTKLDVIAVFNHIQIAEGQEWLTAFNTRNSLSESLVMPFGLSNAPATFQACIIEVLRPYLDVFCTAYINDILIYSDNILSHRYHVNTVLYALGRAGLHSDIKNVSLKLKK